jgi:hypothetical protein
LLPGQHVCSMLTLSLLSKTGNWFLWGDRGLSVHPTGAPACIRLPRHVCPGHPAHTVCQVACTVAVMPLGRLATALQAAWRKIMSKSTQRARQHCDVAQLAAQTLPCLDTNSLMVVKQQVRMYSRRPVWRYSGNPALCTTAHSDSHCSSCRSLFRSSGNPAKKYTVQGLHGATFHPKT